MKKILFPTDFSENAANAFQYAIKLANLFESQILLLHSYQTQSKAGVLVSIAEILVSDAEEEMEKLKKSVEGQLKNGTSLETMIVEGDAPDEINRIAKNWGADLIVMGTQGASGLKEIFIGSNANEVIRSSQIPVLVIPSDFHLFSINKIVLSIDSKELGPESTFTVLKELAKGLQAKILIYHLEAGEGDLGMDPAISPYLKGIDHSFHYELTSIGVNEAIHEFVNDYEADILCLIRRKRNLFEHFFHQSTTAKEVFHSHVPVLVLPG